MNIFIDLYEVCCLSCSGVSKKKTAERFSNLNHWLHLIYWGFFFIPCNHCARRLSKYIHFHWQLLLLKISSNIFTNAYSILKHYCLFCILIQSPVKENECGDPGTPDNGHRCCQNAFKTGVKIDFYCEEGYQMEGDEERTCQEDGMWSGVQPVCNRGEIWT